MRPISLERALISACRYLAQEGLVTATDGNLSLKLKDGILITPTSLAKDKVQEKDLVYLSLDGDVIEGGMPSKEYLFHLELYRVRPDIKAICHAHPTYATALACQLKDSQKLLYDAILRFNQMICLGELEPGSKELAEAVGAIACDYQPILMKRHGAITFARTLDQAVEEMAALERWAKTLFITSFVNAFEKNIMND